MQSAHVAVARMQHVSHEMISDVALTSMALPDVRFHLSASSQMGVTPARAIG
jgi:hypothetical protein